MYDLLALYAEPLRVGEPVVCLDEKSLQLLSHSRVPLPMASCNPTKVDYEYIRKGTTNLFVAIEPWAGKRTVAVTEHRGKTDFVAFIDELLTRTYAKARRVHLVLDNLNIHFRGPGMPCWPSASRAPSCASSREFPGKGASLQS